MRELPESIPLNRGDCRRIFEMIGILSGGNPENIFAQDGTDSPDDPDNAFWAKIYLMAGQQVPIALRDVLSDGAQKEDAQ